MESLTLIALIALSLLCLSAIVGNALIVLSVLYYRGMQTTPNILLASLATADFLVAFLVMPVALVDLAFDHRWQFGLANCRLWTSAHVMLCTASILNLCVIGFDRYLAITTPLRYKRTHTKRLGSWALLITWCISFVICSLPWVIPAWHTSLNVLRCTYPPMLSYRIYFALASFFIPLIIMLFVYMKIVRVIQCRLRLFNLLIASDNSSETFSSLKLSDIHELSSEGSATITFSGKSKKSAQENGDELTARKNSCPTLKCLRRLIVWKSSKTETNKLDIQNRKTETNEPTIAVTITNDDPVKKVRKNSATQRRKESICSCPYILPRRTNSTAIEVRYQRARFCSYPMLAKNDVVTARHLISSTLLSKERKAITTVCVVVSGFVICWMPFFTAHLIEPFCKSSNEQKPTDEVKTTHAKVNLSDIDTEQSLTISCSIPTVLLDIFQWLGYFNSLLNPLIYSFCNKDFRRCFKEILRCRCRSKIRKQRVSMRRLHQPR